MRSGPMQHKGASAPAERRLVQMTGRGRFPKRFVEAGAGFRAGRKRRDGAGMDSEEEAEEVRRQEVHWSVISASSLPCTGLEPPDSSLRLTDVTAHTVSVSGQDLPEPFESAHDHVSRNASFITLC